MNRTYFSRPTSEEVSRRRRQLVTWLRLRYGLIELFRRPWKACIFAAFLTLCYIAWNGRRKILTLNMVSRTPLLSLIYEHAISALILFMSFLLLLGLLMALGTPHQAKEIERRLSQIGLTDRFGDCPVLVSSKTQKASSVRYLSFFSRGISKEMWEQNRTDIEDALNVSWVDTPKYGGKGAANRNYVVLAVTSGTGIVRKETLYDDAL